MNKVFYAIRDFSQKENILSALMKCLYLLFKNSLFKTAFPFAMSIIITATYRSVPQKAGQVIIPNQIIILFVAFLVVEILVWISDTYANGNIASYALSRATVEKMTLHLNTWANRVIDINKRIQREKTISQLKELYLDLSDLQKRSSYLCQNIYSLIKGEYHIENHQISIMVRVKKNHREYIKMIGFANKTNSHPGSITENYYLDDEENKRYLHASIFIDGSNHIRIYKNKKEVQKAIGLNPKSKTRESKIEQLICFPITCEDDGIIALLQIDVDRKIFGSNTKQIEYTIQNTITPFAELVRLWYHKYHFAKLIETIR